MFWEHSLVGTFIEAKVHHSDRLTGSEDVRIEPPISQNSKMNNVTRVLTFCATQLPAPVTKDRYTVQGILQRDISSLLCFVVDVAHFYKCPVPFPSHCSVAIVVTEVNH